MIKIKGDEICLQDTLCGFGVHVGKWGDPQEHRILKYHNETKEERVTRVIRHQEFECEHCGVRKSRDIGTVSV